MSIATRLAELDIVLPPPMRTGGLPFQLVRVHGNRALVAGHVPLDGEGRMAKPLGKVGAEVTPEQGHAAARRCALAMLASLQAELGSLERIERAITARRGRRCRRPR